MVAVNTTEGGKSTRVGSQYPLPAQIRFTADVAGYYHKVYEAVPFRGDFMLTSNMVDRRGFLAGAGALAALSRVPVASRAEPRGTVTRLGDFESGLDGWRTDGRNELARVNDDQFAGSVAHGNWALAVRTEGDSYPMIDNRRLARRADFKQSPYLQGTVVPVIADAAGEVVFRFRFYHTSSPDGRDHGGEQRGSPTVIESPEIRVPQLNRSRVYWDMSGLDDEALENPVGLGIAWYHADHPPRGGPRGTDRGRFDYQGYTLFDDIHLTDDPADIGTTAARDQLRNLRLTHGLLVSVETDELIETSESGRFLFTDGTGVPYSFEQVGSDRFVYVIGDEAFKLGGGW